MSEKNQDKPENESLLDLFPSIDEIPLPGKVKTNAVLALAKGIGNLITALIDIPTAYLERISYSTRAKTAAEAIVIKAAAESAGDQFKKDSDLTQRAVSYLGHKILEEQKNRENVARKTILELKSKTFSHSTDTDIDLDWLTIFWRLAETKSNEDVQELLSKLLANEIERPKSVSPHTLQLLSILTSDLAKSFERLSCLSIDDGKQVYVIHPNVFSFQNIGPLIKYGVSYDDLFDLDGAGLIRSAETILLNHAKDENSVLEEVDYAGSPALLNVSGKQLNLLQFTKAGRELRNLIALERNESFTQVLKQKLGDESFKATF